MRWASIIPLIGGQVLGTHEATGVAPSTIMSYPAFAGNDQHTQRRYPTTPWIDLTTGRPDDHHDLIVSTCPCAGLSSLSKAKTGSDQREKLNDWMRLTTELTLKELKPAAFLGENAPNLFTDMGRSVSDPMIKLARENSYSVMFYRTSTVYHGIPQRRPRAFYLFFKSRYCPEPIAFSKDATPKARDFLTGETGEIWKDLRDDSTYQFLRQRYGDRWRDAGQDGYEPVSSVDMLRDCQLLRQFVDTWTGVKDPSYRMAKKRLEKLDGNVFLQVPFFPRFNESYPSVIGKFFQWMVHPVEDRFLGYRELASLMGMPSDFELPSNQDRNMICQNVPVPTARDVTTIATRFLDGTAPTTKHDVLWYDNTNGQTFVGPERRPIGSMVEPEVDTSIFD